MGWATGLQSGITLGKAFKEGQERRRLEGIRTAAPETSQGYTAEQGQQLEAMASAINPETGRPYYKVQVGEGGNYTVTPDFTEAQTPRTGMDTGSQYGVANVELQPTGEGRAGIVAQPIPFNQQRVTDFLGRRFEGELTPDRIEAMRSRAMAEGLSDPRMRQAALAEATRAEREAVEAPLRLQALETQVAAGKLGLKRTEQELTAGERAAAAAQRMDDFNAWRSRNPQAGFAEINAEVQRLGMDVEQQFKVASSLTGIKEQAFKDSQMRIRDLVKGQGLDGLLKAHKESNDLDPGSHFEVTRGKDGKVSLNRVDTATGQILQPNVFSGSEAETTAYLNKAAMDPATIIDFTMNLEKNKLGMDRDRAAIRASDATVNYRAQQGRALVAAQGLTQKQEDYQRKLDGVFEGYQAAVALGPQGRQAAAIYAREYDQLRASVPKGLRAPPSITSMNEAQKAEKPEKPVKVEEAGVQYKLGGKLMQTDGMGNLISAKGILPTDRVAALKSAGISDNNANRLMWSDDGETVMFNNEEFDVRDKRDMAKLNKELERYDVMSRAIAEEARLRANPTSPSGFQGARTTGIGPASTYGVAPGAQSIYGR